MTRAIEEKPRLLLLFASADHPQRDAVCATLAWLAEAEGSLFECYYDSTHSGIHFGGGHPGWYSDADLRGSTVTGGRHHEALYLLLQRCRCEAACLGPSLFDVPLRDSGIPIRSTSGDAATFYREVFAGSGIDWPSRLLVVGDGGRPQGIPLTPYAFPEIVHRRVLAVADRDDVDLCGLGEDMVVEGMWLPAERAEAIGRHLGRNVVAAAVPPGEPTVAAQTAWMARRWRKGGDGFLLGDPELAGRWTPTAVRRGWTALYGIPQTDVIRLMKDEIAESALVHGRQHHDQDFMRLSELGVAMQVIDPGSPPFPVLRETARRWPSPPDDDDQPSDEQLRRWADEGRVLSTLLFWTGMIRELQNVHVLTDVLSVTGIAAGLVLTTESFFHMTAPPLTLVNVPRAEGGLWPRVELLLTDTADGVLLAAHAPPDRFARSLQAAIAALKRLYVDDAKLPIGWWAHLDAPMIPGPPPRVSRFPEFPQLRLRYAPQQRELLEPVASNGAHLSYRHVLRRHLRESPLNRFFAPLRPYESYRLGPASLSVLEAVRSAGFEYALTKAAYGPVPRVISGVDGLTVVNHTAGRWDGWSPFLTVNALVDLQRAEHRLLRRHQPGWLVGALDTCLWAFTGPVLERGTELYRICRWLAAGGSSGRLVNVTPRTVARYAQVLAETGRVESVAAG